MSINTRRSPYDYDITYYPLPENWEQMRDRTIDTCQPRIQMINSGYYNRPTREHKGGPPIKQCMFCTVESNDYSSISFSNPYKVICRKCRIHISTLKHESDYDVETGYDSEEEGKAEDAMRPKDDFEKFSEAVLNGQTETVFKRFVPNGPFIPVSRIKHEHLRGQELENAIEDDRLNETLTVEQYEASQVTHEFKCIICFTTNHTNLYIISQGYEYCNECFKLV